MEHVENRITAVNKRISISEYTYFTDYAKNMY